MTEALLTSQFVIPAKAGIQGSKDALVALGPRFRGGDGTGPTEPLAVYIHWPFCRSKCPYCDFNSHVRDRVDAPRWTRALLRDLDYHASLAPGREVGSVFFGGGTPSLMPPDTVAALLNRVHSQWAVASDLEVTLEANPNSAEADSFHHEPGA